MPIQHVITIGEGDVFVTPKAAQRAAFRRVLGVLDGRVRYSTGTDTNRTCMVRTFKRWIRTNNCITPRHRTTEVWSI